MRRRGAARLPVVLFALLVVAGLPMACRDAADPREDTGFRSETRRPTPIVRLVELVPEISGEAVGDDALIERWSGAALDRWAMHAGESSVRLTSPELVRIADVGSVEIELRPGSARRLVLIPTVHGDDDDGMRRVRSIEVPIEDNLAPDTVVQIRIDVAETLRGNWGDSTRDGTLDRLEIELIDADPASLRLESVSLLRRNAIAQPFAARSAIAELKGRLHPSWWVRRDSAATFSLDLPEGAPELRWFEGGLTSGEEPRVELLTDEARFELDPGARAEGEPGWRSRSAALAAWAGQRVAIRLANTGAGVALFGDPRIVPGPSRARPTDVIVYLIDALRADHVGAFGSYFDGITPTLDRLIAEGVGFEMALSHSPWTKPTIATLMTGLLPTTHRVGSRTLSDRVPSGVAMVQERFRGAGWRTASFAANPLGSTLSGLERGFGTALAPRYWRRPELGMHPSATQIRQELLRWIDMEPDRPFFAYVHVMEVHPQGRRHHGRDRPASFTEYAASVRAADADLADLLRSLEERQRVNDLLLVVLGDHGDSLGEHGRRWLGHGTSLFQEQIHVPLVFWRRGGPQREPVSEPVGLADVSPTLVDLFDLPPLEPVDGVTLGRFLSGDEAEPRAISSALIRFPHRPDAPIQHSLVSPEGLKAIWIGEKQQLTFDLRRDPGERSPISQDAGVEVLLRDLEQRIETYPARADAFDELHGAPGSSFMNAEELERLRELGYVR